MQILAIVGRICNFGGRADPQFSMFILCVEIFIYVFCIVFYVAMTFSHFAKTKSMVSVVFMCVQPIYKAVDTLDFV